MLVKERWDIENALFCHYLKLIWRTHSINNCTSLWPRLMKTRIELQSIHCVGQNKHFKLDLDRKLYPWLKFAPNFLTWLPNCKNRKEDCVSAIFLFYSIFSDRNQISFFFTCKAYDKLITMTGKERWGAPTRWWTIAIFQLTEVKIKANPPNVQYALARGNAKWRHKLCAERMHDTNMKNHLNAPCEKGEMVCIVCELAWETLMFSNQP